MVRRVGLIIFTGNSGSDIYYKRIKELVHSNDSLSLEMIYLPNFLQYFPILIFFFMYRVSKNLDIIHTNAEFGHFFFKRGRKLIVTLHHSVFDSNYRKYTSFSQRLFHDFWIKPNLLKSLRVADKVIVVSDYTRKKVLDLVPNLKNLIVIYNSIDTNYFKNKHKSFKKEEIRLLFVGNPSKRKGFDLLPQIMRKLGPNYNLYFTNGLRNIKSKLVDENIFPLGKLSNRELLEEYGKADIFLFPTRLEGFGYSIVEAMACEKPIVTSNTSAVPEVAGLNKFNILCEVDKVDQFVEGVILQARRLDKNFSFSSNRDIVLKKFSHKVVARKYVEVYNEEF